jgi:hypothetical protein
MSTNNPSTAAFAKTPLTPELCQDIVVRNTPRPSNFNAPDQALGELGVIDAEQTKFHKERIRSDLERIQYKINKGEITSGPAVSVSDCSASVQDNAHVQKSRSAAE